MSFQANAKWDGTTSGYIQSINVAGGENYGFRIKLTGYPKLCGGETGHDWAYLNESQSNYQTFVSVLLSAYMAGKKVTIYTNHESSSGSGYCRIGYVDMRNG